MRKVLITTAILGLLLYCWPKNSAQAADFSEENLQFSVDGGKIYFFQPKTGRIFIYQLNTNRLSQLLSLDKLGADLKQSRSLSIIEELEERNKEP